MVVNVADTVRLAAERDPAASALVTDASVLTWGALDASVDGAAAALRGLSLPASRGAPARVAIALPQVPEFAVAFFGVLRAGLVAVPVNPGYTPRELRHILADSGASVLIASGPVATGVATVRADLPGLIAVYALEPAEGARPLSELTTPAGPVAASGGGEDLAVLLYTSGTSGAPKGAMLPHRALLANQSQVAAVQPPPVRAGDVVLLALPLFHVFGLSAGLIAVAHHAATGVLLERFDPAGALAAIQRHGVSVVGAVPQMYGAWLGVPSVARGFASIRVAVSGGAPLPAEVAQRFLAVTGHPVHQGYGLTETAPVLTTGLGSPVAKPTSIGRPVPGISLRLVAADGMVVTEVTAEGLRGGIADLGGDEDAFDEAGTDPGEIVVRGENLFRGYWPDGAGGPDADGWWATGDVAYADAEGDLFLVDRLGELIIVSGFNVYPREVEHVLAAHPGVAEAAAVGVPDPLTGEAVLAYVVPAAGGPVAADLFEELRLHCGRNLARYKCPTAFELVAELPRSAIGKVRKGSLSRQAAS